MTFTYLDLDKINTAAISQQPFPWFQYQDLIYANQQHQLSSTYPDINFEESFRFSGDKKHYRFNVLPLIHHDKKQENFANLPEAWQLFINELAHPNYIEALLKSYDITTKEYQVDIGLFRFKKGDWVEPHVDHQDKVLTQLFYFNPIWQDQWGGLLLLHEGKNPEQVFAYFPPGNQTSVVLKRTDNAWHSVTAITDNSLADRLTLQLEIWKKYDATI